MSHYYSKSQEKIISNEKTISFEYADKKFSFLTDNGVFCKDYIDFGSRTLLNAFTPNSISAPVLDMGCGYGVLGIVISKAFDKEVTMFDVNERAVNLANKNASLNKVNASAIWKSVEEFEADTKFSACVTNPPIRAGKSVVFAMYKKAYEVLEEKGELFVVIQKKQGAPSSKKYIEELFGNCDIILKDNGYFILRATKC